MFTQCSLFKHSRRADTKTPIRFFRWAAEAISVQLFVRLRHRVLLKPALTVIFASVSLHLMSSMAVASEVKPVPVLDLERYQGKWFELAAIPQFFQRKCVRDTFAEYTRLETGEIRVENDCARADAGRERVEGRARLYDSELTAKLTVTFVHLFGEYRFWAGGDYWVIALDPNYRWAVVGHPSRRYGWVLSRTPSQPMPVIAEIIGRIKSQGYDACEFVVTPQAGGLSIKRPLCSVLP